MKRYSNSFDGVSLLGTSNYQIKCVTNPGGKPKFIECHYFMLSAGGLTALKVLQWF